MNNSDTHHINGAIRKFPDIVFCDRYHNWFIEIPENDLRNDYQRYTVEKGAVTRTVDKEGETWYHIHLDYNVEPTGHISLEEHRRIIEKVYHAAYEQGQRNSGKDSLWTDN